MEYRKPSKKVIIDAVLQVLKERGTIDTQTKMHKKVLAKLKEDDETYRLSAERMRIVAILSKKIKKENIGILVCGSGMGMAMTANKHKNIRAALCYSVKNAKLSRLHNDANVITLGERLISKNLAFKCINTFLNTKFEGGRHLKRIKKI